MVWFCFLLVIQEGFRWQIYTGQSRATGTAETGSGKSGKVAHQRDAVTAAEVSHSVGLIVL